MSGLENLPTEAIVAGGAAVVAAVSALVWAGTQNSGMIDTVEVAEEVVERAPPPPPRENAVMVLGATGRVGRRVVQKLILSGRTVVAAVRSTEKARTVYQEIGVKEGVQEDASGILFIDEGVDVTNPETLDRPELWKGVTQVVSLLGPVFGPQPGGGMGYFDDMTPERVEAGGWKALASILPKHLKKQQVEVKDILPMVTNEDLTAWDKMDDVIMGGNSSSGMVPLDEGVGVAGAAWSGDLIVEGGGFCGTRTKRMDMDLSGYDGIHMRVRGDGQIFKMNIKTLDQLDTPESTYQTSFDTVPGQWSDVYLPWHNFVSVKRAQSDPSGAPLDPSKISKFGLVLSRFEFNGMPNPSYKPGPWKLEIAGGIKGFKDVRPQIVLLSSGGVERNAIIGDDEEARKKDIPIVQLNPGGTLNYKYQAEVAARSTGYPYSVIRSTGMIDSNEGGPFMLEADQGDTISGYMGRDDVADVILASLNSADACFKTFEVRRAESADSKGKGMSVQQYTRMFLKLGMDRNRWRVGLKPFPKAVPPPPPPSEKRVEEIVGQVKQIQQAAKMDVTPNASDKEEVKAIAKNQEEKVTV